jgi:hypothetical protein
VAKGKLETKIVMKTLAKLLTVLAIAALGQSAMAIVDPYLFTTADFVDQEYWHDDPLAVNPEISGQLSVASQLGGSTKHFYDNFGYDKNLHVVTAIEILFALNSDVVNISFGAIGAGPGVIGSDVLDLFTGPGPYIHEFDFVGGFSGALLVNLVNTGVLDWTVALDSGQSYADPVELIAVSLAVETETRSVPDSASTLGLFGVCLAGLVGFKRRFS